MVDFKKDIWLYGLIAAILALIGILVPWGSLDGDYSWLGGLIGTVDGDFVGANGLSIWTIGLISMSIAALLIYSINTWKGKEFKWDWLIYILTGLTMFILPILVLVLEGTEDAFPIGGILIIIAGVIAIIGFVFDKFGDKIFKGGV